MKRLLIIILLMPLLSPAQSILDSTVFRFSQGDIRYYVVRQTATAANTDSIYVSHGGVRALLSPSQLPISTLQQTALDLKQGSLGYTPLNPANNLSEVTASTARTNLGLGTLSTQSGIFSGTWADSTRTALYSALAAKQSSITTGTTSQYFRGDLSLATFPTTTASFTSSTNKNFVTDAQSTVIGNTSGTNTGDQTITLTGDVTGSGTGSFATTIGATKVTNSMLSGSIAYSKLSLTGAILNADLAGSIAYSKLSLTGAVLNADLAGSIAYSKLSLTGAILNGDLAGSIASSKLVGTDISTVGTVTAGTIAIANGITSTGTAGIGYATGAGGTVTQATNRSTGVTINKISGAITTNNTSLAAGAEATFVITNSTVAVGDVILISSRSGQTANTSIAVVTAVAAGSFSITLSNLNSATADTGAMIINFCVIKAVSA